MKTWKKILVGVAIALITVGIVALPYIFEATKENTLSTNANTQTKDNRYLQAISLYETHMYDEAMEIFKELEDYKSSKDYISRIPRDKKIHDLLKDYTGTWKFVKIDDESYTYTDRFVFDANGKISYYVTDGNYAKFTRSVEITEINENSLKIKHMSSYSEYSFEEYTLVFNSTEINFIGEYENCKMLKQNDKVNLPTVRKVPTIGMTKEEAEKSTWGMPEKVNKTTTAYGLSEQWVYGNRKYLYFKDGILTSIQE